MHQGQEKYGCFRRLCVCVCVRAGPHVKSVARYSARKLLDDNTSLLLVPGGATEALYAKPGANTLVLRRRLGFVRLALQTGDTFPPEANPEL